jgi:hypothetical protein
MVEKTKAAFLQQLLLLLPLLLLLLLLLLLPLLTRMTMTVRPPSVVVPTRPN